MYYCFISPRAVRHDLVRFQSRQYSLDGRSNLSKCILHPDFFGVFLFSDSPGKEEIMNNLIEALMENVVFVLESLLVVVLMFIIAYAGEKLGAKYNGTKQKSFTTKKIAVTGVFSAIAAVLMLVEVVMPFAPSFYKLDLSEIPVLICSFVAGPAAGVMAEFCKIILKLLLKSTSTAFVGELANFAVGCSFILPASILYQFKKTKKIAIIGCAIGTVVLVIFATIFNGIYLLPKFAELYGMPLDTIIAMGTAINPNIKNVTTFVIFAVAPINLIKGMVVSFVTIIVYKKISVLLRSL